MSLLRWLFDSDSLGALAHWTPERAAKAERETLIRDGRVVEPSYTWHPKFLAQYQRQQKRAKEREVFEERRSA